MTDVREQLQRAQAGDKEARNCLVQENIGLVKHIVSRYTARGERRFISDRDDRASEGH